MVLYCKTCLFGQECLTAKHLRIQADTKRLEKWGFMRLQRRGEVSKQDWLLWPCFLVAFFSFLFYRQKSGSFPESKNAINDKSSCTSLKTLWLKFGYIAFFHQRWSGSHRSVLRPQYFDRAVKEWRCGGRLPDCEAAESSEARYGSDKGEYVYRCKEDYFLLSTLTPVSLSKFTGWSGWTLALFGSCFQ